MEKEDLEEIIRRVAAGCNIEDIGRISDSDLYYLGSGCYTGKQGWEDFKKELKNQIDGEKRKS